MSRLIVALGVLAVAWSARAKEVDVRFASVGPTAMKSVRRIELAATDLGNVVVRPWPRADAQLVATKSAADQTTLGRMRVEVAVVGDTMSVRFGELVGGAWAPLPAGARIDLVLNVPARLTELCAPPVPIATR